MALFPEVRVEGVVSRGFIEALWRKGIYLGAVKFYRRYKGDVATKCSNLFFMKLSAPIRNTSSSTMVSVAIGAGLGAIAGGIAARMWAGEDVRKIPLHPSSNRITFCCGSVE